MTSSSQESVFFPSLGRCLNNEARLLSWKDVHEFLELQNKSEFSHIVGPFLSDTEVIQILKNPANPYKKPSPQSKAKFDTHTSAINVTPSTNGKFDIARVKEDALWLSKEADIDELSALRLVALEHQKQPELRLQNGFTEEETLSIQTIVAQAPSSVSANVSSNEALQAQRGLTTEDLFLSTTQRKQRLLYLFLEERAQLLYVSDFLLRACAYANEAKASSDEAPLTLQSWISAHKVDILSTADESSVHAVLAAYNVSLESRLHGLETGSGFEDGAGSDASVENAWATMLLTETVLIMRHIFTLVDIQQTTLSPEPITGWFTLAARYGFFDDLQFTAAQQQLLPQLQAMFSLVSLQMLKLPQALDGISHSAEQPQPNSYLRDLTCVRTVTDIFVEAVYRRSKLASPSVLAWAILGQAVRSAVGISKPDLIRRTSFEKSGGGRTSAGADSPGQVSQLEEILDAFLTTNLEEDAVTFLASGAVDGASALDVIAALADHFRISLSSALEWSLQSRACGVWLSLLRETSTLVSYGSELGTAVLAVLSARRPNPTYPPLQTSERMNAPIHELLQSEDSLKSNVWDQSCLRYPFEAVPFLNFCQTIIADQNASSPAFEFVHGILENTGAFSQLTPLNFQSYQVDIDEGPRAIRLTKDLPLFIRRRKLGDFDPVIASDGKAVAIRTEIEEEFYIPAGTVGYNITEDSKPFVATWRYNHSALHYLPTLLSTYSESNDRLEWATKDSVDAGTAAAIVGLYSSLIQSCVRSNEQEPSFSDGLNTAYEILGLTGDGPHDSQDIVAIVLDIFEQELQQQLARPVANRSLNLLCQLLSFMSGAIAVVPGRVWPFLARSALLDIDGNGALLGAIVSSTEIATGQFDFLLGCIQLYQALVQDAVANAVSRKSSTTRAIARFGAPQQIGHTTPDKTIANVLLLFTRIFVDVLESSSAWRFSVIEQKFSINKKILSSFQNILQWAHGYDDSSDSTKPLTATLNLSSLYLADVFLSPTGNGAATRPLIEMLNDAMVPPPNLLSSHIYSYWLGQSQAALTTCTLLVRFSMFINRTRTQLGSQLLAATPILARIYANNPSLRILVLDLLKAVMTKAGKLEVEPPSLLGHLGTITAREFLDLLAKTPSLVPETDLELEIWAFFAHVISQRQQWLAIYLLTGVAPRESLRAKKPDENDKSSTPVFDQALDILVSLGSMNGERAAAILDFVIQTQSKWPQAVATLRKHTRFQESIMDFLGNLKAPRSSNVDAEVEKIYKSNHLAAHVAEVLAAMLHNSRQDGDASKAKALVTKLYYFRDNGVMVNGYNTSLHVNLKRNFEQKFPRFSLQNIKHTTLLQPVYGKDYYYGLDFAAQAFRLQSPQNPVSARQTGFMHEIERANLNFSLIQSQITLLRSWTTLALELSQFVAEEPRLRPQLARVVNDCLTANATSNLPGEIAKDLIDDRLDLAFALAQRLVEAGSVEPEVLGLFDRVWDAVRNSGQDFEVAFMGDRAGYYRALLRLLFLSLRPHLVAPKDHASIGIDAAQSPKFHSPAIAGSLLEVLHHVVATGFRSLCTQLHEDASTVSPNDFVLLIALLQAILAVPGIAGVHSQITLQISSSGVVRNAMSLFSWSHRLSSSSSTSLSKASRGNDVVSDPIYGELAVLFLLELSSLPALAEHLAVEGVLTQLASAPLTTYYRRAAGMSPTTDPVRAHSIWTRGLLPLCLNLLQSVGSAIGSEVAAFLNGFAPQLKRCNRDIAYSVNPTPKPATEPMTLALASEVHSISLLHLILTRYRLAGPAAPTQYGGDEALEVLQWDASAAKEDLEGWLEGNRRVLKGRLHALTDRDLSLLRAPATAARSTKGAESQLEELVVQELEGALACLRQANAESSGN